MPRLKRSDCSQAGWTRKKRGKTFIYLDCAGNRISDEADLDRVTGLVIPPAWQDVWICPYPNGHIQAVGVDAKGRKQYRYHDAWRTRRDAEKFDHMIEFGRSLPALRTTLALDLSGEELSRTRVLACAVRLLDLGFFRIGGEDYAEENGTYGLATMRKEHVSLDPGASLVVFDYTAKHGKHRVQSIVDPEVFEVLATLKKRRGGNGELLAFRQDKQWLDVKSADINAYVKNMTGKTFSAKDFRTWNATVLASVALGISAEMARASETARKRAITRAIKEVSEYLGNTPAVARSSYIDPRVIDRFRAGETINDALDRIGVDTPPGHPATQGPMEEAVLRLLESA